MEEETKTSQETSAVGISTIIIVFGVLGAFIVTLEDMLSIYLVLPIIMNVSGKTH